MGLDAESSCLPIGLRLTANTKRFALVGDQRSKPTRARSLWMP